MPEYLSPGVYVEEIDTGNKPIEGVATSTVGFLGLAERGPVVPTLITSFSDYVRNFGSYLTQGSTDRYLTYAVEGFFQNGGKRCYIERVVSSTAKTATLTLGGMTVNAVGPGASGDRIAVKVEDGTQKTQANDYFKLTILYWSPARSVPGLSGATGTLIDPTDPAKAKDPNRRDPTILEVFDNLTADQLSSAFYVRQVTNASVLIELVRKDATAIPRPQALTSLAGGDDGAALTPADLKGDPDAPPGQKRGLLALEEVDDIAILCCPDETDPNFPGITDALVDQCENLKDRFAIIQALQDAKKPVDHRPTRFSKYAGYYYPWLEVRNPTTGLLVTVPPGGHLAGIYARTDIERGVHKAPANEDIRGIDSLQLQITKGQQDVLNPRGVNVLRYFPGRGNLVWGARTSSPDPDWKYINVRRLFIFVEKSIEQGTQWVVFEPNDEPLWARVRRSVSDFLTRLWMDGMLQGATKEQAYFVRCDRTTMTQADIDNGRLIVLVGIAPVKPAEFVIFRIGQWTGGSDVSEG